MAHFDPFLRDKLKSYPNSSQAFKDAKGALEQYGHLKPLVKKFSYPDGVSKDLVCLEGTIPVAYRGSTYNIPVCIWLQDRHPYIPPLCYVIPTAEMEIRAGRHVDTNGRVYLPFLTDWKHPQSDLYGLIQVLCLIFAEQPPVFARTRPTPPAGTHRQPTPRPPYAGYQQYPGPYYPGHTQMPPGGMPQGPRQNTPPYTMPSQQAPGPARAVPPGRPPPPTRPPPAASYPPQPQAGFPMPGMPQPTYPNTTNYPPVPPVTTAAAVSGITRDMQNSFKIPPDMMRASLKCAVEDKIKRRLNEIFAQAQAEMETLKKTENDLNEGKRKLDNMIQQIETEEAEVTKDIAILTQKNKEIEEMVSTLQQQSDKMNIDDAVVPTTPLYNQILELYAEENSLDDTMYYLGEALRREKIELDVFLKNVRSLSRRQFMSRALLQKARKTAGLSEL